MAPRLEEEVALLVGSGRRVGTGQREFSAAEAAAVSARVPSFGGAEAVWHGAATLAASSGVILAEAASGQRFSWVAHMEASREHWLEKCLAVAASLAGGEQGSGATAAAVTALST